MAITGISTKVKISTKTISTKAKDITKLSHYYIEFPIIKSSKSIASPLVSNLIIYTLFADR